MTQADLFVPKSGGGFYMLTLEAPPGIFVEPWRDGGNGGDLTADELQHVVKLWLEIKRLGWTKIGFEAGREYEAVTFRANCADTGIMDPKQWRLAEQITHDEATAETHELQPWAVEFTNAERRGFCRRRFWYANKAAVPTVEEMAKWAANARAAREKRRQRKALLEGCGKVRLTPSLLRVI